MFAVCIGGLVVRLLRVDLCLVVLFRYALLGLLYCGRFVWFDCCLGFGGLVGVTLLFCD